MLLVLIWIHNFIQLMLFLFSIKLNDEQTKTNIELTNKYCPLVPVEEISLYKCVTNKWLNFFMQKMYCVLQFQPLLFKKGGTISSCGYTFSAQLCIYADVCGTESRIKLPYDAHINEEALCALIVFGQSSVAQRNKLYQALTTLVTIVRRTSSLLVLVLVYSINKEYRLQPNL